MREQVHVAGAKHETSAELEYIFSQSMLAMPARLRTRTRFRIVSSQQMQDVRLSQSHGAVRPPLLVDQQRKRDAGLFTKCPRIGPIAQPDGCQIQLVLVFAQLRDMLAAENSTVVAEKNNHRRRRFPKRAQTEFAAIAIGQNDIGERRAKRVGHAETPVYWRT